MGRCPGPPNPRGHRGDRDWPGQAGLGGPKAAAAAATIRRHDAHLDNEDTVIRESFTA